ncbi:MAG: hypothetical protein LRY27_04830, partial [Chitinophagales bacterium]|nr:hypothetical protein [Chitinophagales bacterium]
KETKNDLVGVWEYESYDTDLHASVYNKVKKFSEDKGGYEFKRNGDLIDRNSGWCGTPPLVYQNYNGTWKLKDNLILVNTEISEQYSLEIISIENKKLVAKYIN